MCLFGVVLRSNQVDLHLNKFIQMYISIMLFFANQSEIGMKMPSIRTKMKKHPKIDDYKL